MHVEWRLARRQIGRGHIPYIHTHLKSVMVEEMARATEYLHHIYMHETQSYNVSACHTAILIIIEGHFQVFQRFSSSKLVLKTVGSRCMGLNYYENGSKNNSNGSSPA